MDLQSRLAVGRERDNFSRGVRVLVVASHNIRTIAADLTLRTRSSRLSIFAHDDNIDTMERSAAAAGLAVVRCVEGNDWRGFGKTITFADGDANIIHEVDDLLGTGGTGDEAMSHIATESIPDLVKNDGIQDAGLEVFQKAEFGTAALLGLGLLVAKL